MMLGEAEASRPVLAPPYLLSGIKPLLGVKFK
jgi:hypothetical protein